MPFCFAPWTNIDIDPQGRIAPCCKFQFDTSTPRIDVVSGSVDQYNSSEFLKHLKQQWLKNEWPSGCDRCKIEEQSGISSKRQLDQLRWQHYYDQYDIDRGQYITASVAFGNTCNLKCITCSSYSSSHWHDEDLAVNNRNFTPVHFYKSGFTQGLIDHAPHLVHLDIPGGEPLLAGTPAHQDLLEQYAASGQAREITLHYTTNATIFPKEKWWRLWENFAGVEFQISLDGVDRQFEYIRFPAHWEYVIDNVKKYQQHVQQNTKDQLSISHTVSAFNIYYLDNFVEWCYTSNLPVPWLGRVHNPKYMRPTVWPNYVKEIFVNKLQSCKHDVVKPWIQLLLQHDDSEWFEEFKFKAQQHDQYRGLDFKSCFPELIKFL